MKGFIISATILFLLSLLVPVAAASDESHGGLRASNRDTPVDSLEEGEDELRDLSHCTVKFDLFNAQTDKKVASLTNYVTIANPPPCGQANIEAVVPCGDSDDKVIMELYLGGQKIRKATDPGYPYFLWGNNGYDVKNGKLKAGYYSIRAQVNGAWTPFTYFTIGGSCS